MVQILLRFSIDMEDHTLISFTFKMMYFNPKETIDKKTLSK